MPTALELAQEASLAAQNFTKNSRNVEVPFDQAAALRALMGESGTDVAFLRSYDGIALGFILDAGSGNVLPVMRVTVNAPTDVIAAQRISNGGINTFETGITGGSAEGEVFVINIGYETITSVHIGSSAGASQVLDANGTVLNTEIGKWTCLEADDCNAVYLRFAPPRSSGRYCDVQIFGKRRA